jgi:serpin B
MVSKPKIKIPVFRADHPFLFLLRDTRTGCILFMGRVMQPPRETQAE